MGFWDDENDHTKTAHNNVGESYKLSVELKKPDVRDHMLYNSIMLMSEGGQINLWCMGQDSSYPWRQRSDQEGTQGWLLRCWLYLVS